MNYSEALEWLYGCQKIGIKLGLQNTRKLLKALSIEHGNRFVFHIAGTNGKGSVCAYLESICRQAGLRTGMFTSPHLISFAERIRVQGKPLSETYLAKEITAMRSLVKGWDPHPTFFELNTAMGQKCFRDLDVEVVILETGLGGRLDSTNAIESDVAVITPIGLDHQQLLGDTIELIAAEKAGIIKPGNPIVTGQQTPGAEAVLRTKAEELGSAYHRVQSPLPAETTLGLFGPHQFWNAALAVKAIEVSGLPIPEDAIRSGLAETQWPARFQELAGAQNPIIIDGAHNPPAAEVLVNAWRARFGEVKAALVFGAVKDKDVSGILQTLQPIIGQIIPTTTPTDRGLKAEELVEKVGLRGVAPEPDIAQALAAAQATGLPVLVAGSIFLAGSALEALGWAEQRFEPSSQ